MKFEELSVGDSIPSLQKEITQEVINRWAEVSTDFNPLHVDPEFAKKTRFGGTIAHGHIALSFLCEMMHRWLGPGWISGGGLAGIKFIAPIRPGYTISMGGTITEKGEGDVSVGDGASEPCLLCELQIHVKGIEIR